MNNTPEPAVDYGIVVGIKHYPDHIGLNGSIACAQAMAAWLRSARGGGVRECYELYSTEQPPWPGTDAVDDEFTKLINSLEPARRLYIYFSGHGLASDQLGADLCLTAWSYIQRNRAINSASYRDSVASFGRFREIVMLLDCCRTDLAGIQGRPCGFCKEPPDPRAGDTRFFVAFGTPYNQESFEAPAPRTIVIDGEPMPVWSFFTQALLLGLNGEARNEQGVVASDELESYLRLKTKLLAQDAGFEQESRVLKAGLDQPLIFGPAAPEAPSEGELQFDFSSPGIYQLTWPNGFQKDSLRVEVDPQNGQLNAPIMQLRRGNYLVHEQTSGRLIHAFTFSPSTSRQYVKL